MRAFTDQGYGPTRSITSSWFASRTRKSHPDSAWYTLAVGFAQVGRDAYPGARGHVYEGYSDGVGGVVDGEKRFDPESAKEERASDFVG